MMTELQRFYAALPMGLLITQGDLDTLQRLDRLHPVLVRCGSVRFTCAIQDLARLRGYVAAGGDYVRDCSIPATLMDGMRARQLAIELAEAPAVPVEIKHGSIPAAEVRP